MADAHRLINIRPFVNDDLVLNISSDIFGLSDVRIIKELVSYDDRNFHVSGLRKGVTEREEFVLKVLHSRFSYKRKFADWKLNFMHQMALNSSLLHLPRVVNTLNGESNVLVPVKMPSEMQKDVSNDDHVVHDKEGSSCFMHIVRMATYLQGDLLSSHKLNPTLLFEVGKMLAEFQTCSKRLPLEQCDDYERPWDLRCISLLRDPYLLSMKDEERRVMSSTVIDAFENRVAPMLDELPRLHSHMDLNEANILMVSSREDNIKHPFGIIDFGDCSYAYRIFDPAILIMYMILEADLQKIYMSPVEVSRAILKGYFTNGSVLTDNEFKVLYDLITSRMVQSLLIGHHQVTRVDPDNVYLMNTSRNGWRVLASVLDTGREAFETAWKSLLPQE